MNEAIWGHVIPQVLAERERIDLYKQALEDMWKNSPNNETQKRLHGFVSQARLARVKWIDWVERTAAQDTSPAWCVELVGMAVARKIGASQ